MADAKLTDPLGREIVLHDHTWHAHIVKYHPEVKPHRSLVEQAIGSPDEIRHSNSDADCRLYYGPGPRADVIMMLVGDVSLGIVKTAHLARKVTGGALEWSK
jgi:hypothetical protein